MAGLNQYVVLPVCRHVASSVRRLICRKVLLVRPHLLAVAVCHCTAGYFWALRRLRQGPICLREETLPPDERTTPFTGPAVAAPALAEGG